MSFDYRLDVTVPEGLTVANGGELLGREERGDQVRLSYRNLRPSWRIDIAIAAYEVLENESSRVFAFPAENRLSLMSNRSDARAMTSLVALASLVRSVTLR